MVEVVGGGGGGGSGVVVVVGGGGGGGGWVVVGVCAWVVVNPPLSMLLGSYCSLEKTLKKGSPPLALAHYLFCCLNSHICKPELSTLT